MIRLVWGRDSIWAALVVVAVEDTSTRVVITMLTPPAVMIPMAQAPSVAVGIITVSLTAKQHMPLGGRIVGLGLIRAVARVVVLQIKCGKPEIVIMLFAMKLSV